MDSGNPLINEDLWLKVVGLPLEDLEAWGRSFALAAADGDQPQMLRLLESLELTAKLWANPMYEADTGAELPKAVDMESFIAQMRAQYGKPELRNHSNQEFPDVG